MKWLIPDRLDIGLLIAAFGGAAVISIDSTVAGMMVMIAAFVLAEQIARVRP